VRDVDHMIYSMQKYILLDFATSGTIEFVLSHKLGIILIILFWAVHFVMYRFPDFNERIANLKLGYWGIFFLGIVLLILLFFNGEPQDFYYFQF